MEDSFRTQVSRHQSFRRDTLPAEIITNEVVLLNSRYLNQDNDDSLKESGSAETFNDNSSRASISGDSATSTGTLKPETGSKSVFIDSSSGEDSTSPGVTYINPLIDAISRNDFVSVQRALNDGYDVNTPTTNTLTSPLLKAIMIGDIEIVRLLVAWKANINYRGEHGNTPLISAYCSGKKEILIYLLSKRANILVANDVDQTFEDFVFMNDDVEIYEILTTSASGARYVNTERSLLKAKEHSSTKISALLNKETGPTTIPAANLVDVPVDDNVSVHKEAE